MSDKQKVFTVTNTTTVFRGNDGIIQIANSTEFNFDLPQTENQQQEYDWVNKQPDELRIAYQLGEKSRRVNEYTLDEFFKQNTWTQRCNTEQQEETVQ